ncbi:MAG: MFS transporter [Nibricoccus sp.]
MNNSPSSQKLSFIEKLGFGAGDLSINVVVYSLFMLLLIFQTDVFGLTPADAGKLGLQIRALDALLDLTMGVITDKFNTRWGRYRPYLLLFAIPFGLSIVLLYTTPDFTSYASKLVWAYATYAFTMVMFTAVVIPYISLPGVITNSPQERLSANGYRLFMAKVGATALAFAVPLLVKEWGMGNPAKGYQLAMGLMGVVAAVLLLFCFFTTKERVQHTADKISLWAQYKMLMKNDHWLILCAVCVIGTIGYVIRTGVAAYYAKYYLGGDEKVLATFLTVSTVASILAMVASTWITKRICKLQLFRWSQIIAMLISVAMYFVVKPGDTMLAFVFFFVIFFVVDLHAPVFWSLISESIDYGAIKTGERVTGLAYGGISFYQKAGGGLATWITSYLLTYCHYVPNQIQSDGALRMIALTTAVIPAIFNLLMALVMFKYKITDKYYHLMLSNPASVDLHGGKLTRATNHILAIGIIALTCMFFYFILDSTELVAFMPRWIGLSITTAGIIWLVVDYFKNQSDKARSSPAVNS